MLRAKAHAKLNLTLAVGRLTDDGYHPLRSIFVRLGMADELAVDHARDAASDQLRVEGDYDCPVDGNLVLRAFDLLRRAAGQPLPPLSARLIKRIPVGAGLGGGSSDGAAAVELAARAWGIGLAPASMSELGATLGSDVPFFASGQSWALVEGRGERVTALPALLSPAGILLCASAEQLSTAAVYARFDRLAQPSEEAGRVTERLVAALRGGLDGVGLAGMAAQLAPANDLWPAAAELAPALVDLRKSLEQASGRRWLMTGSGPSLYAIYPSPGEARIEMQRLAGAGLAGVSESSLLATATA